MTFTALPYNDYGTAMRRRLGGRVQKLSLDARLGCPHRAYGAQGGGCSFCLDEAFSPSYCRATTSISEQIDAALRFHSSRRRRADHYLAYFQAGTNTNADIQTLRKLYTEAAGHPAIAGIIVGTRPDCISFDIVELFDEISHSKYVAVEYGIEATDDAILRHVNRGHSYADAVAAIALTRRATRVDIGAHFILGLPYHTRDSIVASVADINALGLDYVKFHQLQIYRHTPIAAEWAEHRERFLLGRAFDAGDYADILVDIIRRLSPATAIDRFLARAPGHMLVDTPFSGLDADALRHMILERMGSLGAVQGDMLPR